MKEKVIKAFFLSVLLCLLAGCSSEKVIVNGLPERDANEIIVFLSGKNIDATKVPSSAGNSPGGNQKAMLWDVEVPPEKAIEAMNYLDQAGLPRRLSPNLLEIFGNTGLVPSDMQEKIRYQAGLAQQIGNTIRKIDGILDANVIISFPETDPLTGKTNGPITASVYVKHNGVLDDPNSHLISKIKRLVAASVTGLDYNNVTVIGDRAEVTENPVEFPENNEAPPLVSVWSVDVTKDSLFRFRLIFFSLLFTNLVLILFIIWCTWKLYPTIKKAGWKNLLSVKQVSEEKPEKAKDKTEPPAPKKAPPPEKEMDDI